MKVFVTMCFALVAMAAAKPGYNYEQPQQSFVGTVSGQAQGIVTAPAPGFVSAPAPGFVSGPAPGPVFSPVPQFGGQHVEVAGPGPQYAQQQFVSSAGPQYAQQQFVSSAGPQVVGPAPQFVAPVQQTTVFTPSTSSVVSSPQYHGQVQHQEQQVIVNKDIFIHSAPEETEEINADQGPDQLAPIRKNYRLLFIKAPSHNIKFNVNSLKRAQAANEEKTVIYVLAKKPDVANLQSQLAAVQNEQKTHKPEVYFIKYKTQEEANRAQQEIQAQYDALGGSTHISDEGYAPVTSVIGGKSVGSVGSVGPVVSSAGPAFTSGVVSGPTFTGGAVGGTTFSSGSSYTTGGVSGSTFTSGPAVSTVSHNQQTFVQQSFQGPSSTVSFGGVAPSNKYLPASKKK